MSRILEINPSQEEAVVSRVLLLVHQAIDEKFPNLQNAPRQFTKTVFSDDGENTAQHQLPPDMRDDMQHEVPPPPPKPRQSRPDDTAKAPTTDPSPPRSAQSPNADVRAEGEKFSNSTRLGTEMESLKPESALSDWGTRITVALLIAGIVLLVYAILA